MSGSARGVRSNAHSYRNWGEGLGNDPSYPAAQLSSHRIGQVFILHAGGRPPTRDEGANALPVGVEVMTADATTPTVNGMMYADFFDFT